MSYSYNDANIVNLKHLKKVAERTQDEIANLAGVVAGAIEEAVADKVDGNLRIFYGTCVTAAATQAKTVTIDGLTALQAGDIFVLIMSSGQTYNGAPTLNVNSLGAINIRRITGTNAGQYEWVAGQVVSLVYNGTHFIIMDGGLATTTYYGKTKLSSATDSTSESLAATPAAVKAAYDLANTANTRTLDHLGLFIDDSGYLCQAISTDS